MDKQREKERERDIIIIIINQHTRFCGRWTERSLSWCSFSDCVFSISGQKLSTAFLFLPLSDFSSLPSARTNGPHKKTFGSVLFVSAEGKHQCSRCLLAHYLGPCGHLSVSVTLPTFQNKVSKLKNKVLKASRSLRASPCSLKSKREHFLDNVHWSRSIKQHWPRVLEKMLWWWLSWAHWALKITAA